MPQREIRLDTAAFLDSPQAKSLPAKRDDQKKIVDAFLACSYDEVGKAPRFLDGEDVHAIVGHLLPGHFGRKDPVAEHVVPTLRAYLAFLEENAVATQLFEMRQALEHTADEFLEVVRTGTHAHHAPVRKDAPFVHRADKVGRNDPCPCGSGAKFKHCCAKLG